MSDTDHADELLARIYAYMVRAVNDPKVVNRTPGEMGAILAAWRLVSVTVPDLLPFGAEQLRRHLLMEGAKETAREIVSWAHLTAYHRPPRMNNSWFEALATALGNTAEGRRPRRN